MRAPTCPACGVPYRNHPGLNGTCKALVEALAELALRVAACPECGPQTTCDEDRCCPCGRDLIVFADRYSYELVRNGEAGPWR